MFRYKILIEYDGTNFIGWQSQPKGKSIQKNLEKFISKILKEKIKCVGAGRTDSGVHAYEQVAHFDCKQVILNTNKFLKSLNYFLYNDGIVVNEIKKKSKNFHARYSAKFRIYRYIIVNRNARLVLDRNRAWHIINKLDLKIMKKGSKKLLGTNDFSTFRSSKCNAKSPIKTIKYIKIFLSNNKIQLEFKSESFLQQQVRSMVGCLKYLGEKKWTLKKFEKILRSKQRILCAPPAPPCGLYLKKVIY